MCLTHCLCPTPPSPRSPRWGPHVSVTQGLTRCVLFLVFDALIQTDSPRRNSKQWCPSNPLKYKAPRPPPRAYIWVKVSRTFCGGRLYIWRGVFISPPLFRITATTVCLDEASNSKNKTYPNRAVFWTSRASLLKHFGFFFAFVAVT